MKRHASVKEISQEVGNDNVEFVKQLDEHQIVYACCVALAKESKEVMSYLSTAEEEKYKLVTCHILLSREITNDVEMFEMMLRRGDWADMWLCMAADIAVHLPNHKILDTLLSKYYVYDGIMEKALESAELAGLDSVAEHIKEVIRNNNKEQTTETTAITVLHETELLANEICDFIPPALLVNYPGNTIDKAIAFVREHLIKDDFKLN